MKAFLGWYLILNISMLYGTWYFQYTIEALSAALLIMSSVCSVVYVSYFGDVAKSVGICEDTVRSTFFLNSILCVGLTIARGYFITEVLQNWLYALPVVVLMLMELNTIGKKFDPI